MLLTRKFQAFNYLHMGIQFEKLLYFLIWYVDFNTKNFMMSNSSQSQKCQVHTLYGTISPVSPVSQTLPWTLMHSRERPGTGTGNGSGIVTGTSHGPGSGHFWSRSRSFLVPMVGSRSQSRLYFCPGAGPDPGPVIWLLKYSY